MFDKSKYQSIPYKNVKRSSPHGFLISFVYEFLKKYSISPDRIILSMIKPGNKLLDVGCGDGGFCIKNNNNFNKITGLDISKLRIAKAFKKVANKNKYSFVVSDMDSRIPFRNGTFDVVTVVAAFQYSYNPDYTLSEFNRVLKKGGELYIQVTNLAWIVYRIQLLFGNQIFTSMSHRQTWDGGILHYFTYSSLVELIESHGFVVRRKTCSGLFRNIKLICPSLLASDIIIKAIKK